MIIQLEIKNTENIGNVNEEQKRKFEEVLNALISSGGLSGVRGGQTIIHFDHEGTFQKIELKYFPWVRRKRT